MLEKLTSKVVVFGFI